MHNLDVMNPETAHVAASEFVEAYNLAASKAWDVLREIGSDRARLVDITLTVRQGSTAQPVLSALAVIHLETEKPGPMWIAYYDANGLASVAVFEIPLQPTP